MTGSVKKRKASAKFVSQNVRGLKSDVRLDELFSYIVRMSVLAACVQEIWRSDVETLQNAQCLLLLAGLPSNLQAGKRGSQGVGIVLNAEGVKMLKDHTNTDVAVFLISAYAPVSSAPDSVLDEYYDRLDECMQRKRHDDILVIGTDSNSSIGTVVLNNGPVGQFCPVGQFGLNHVNAAGRRLPHT